MVKRDWLLQALLVLSVLRGVELRLRQGILEDTGDPTWDFIVSYLEYEEPEYNQKKGFTADDFTDHLVGYQTQASHARSFGWETAGYGQIPFAALLVNHNKTKFCMGTVVTDRAVVTPCACVRSMGFRDKQTSDYDIRGKDKNKHYYYEYDIGLNIDVVANRIEYIEDHVGRGFYPYVTRSIPDKCFEIWNQNIQVKGNIGQDYTKPYQQLFYPAILELSNNLEFEAPCPWPPFELQYKNQTTLDLHGGSVKYHYYFNHETDDGPESAIISSFKFIPLEDRDLSMDNDGRGLIKTQDRLVNVQADLCSQRFCSDSDLFRTMNRIWYFGDKLSDMLCWCDKPWLDEEVIFHNLRNDEVPVYFKSVYGGLIGAPVIHKGVWVAWTVERVTREITKRELRPTWSRGVDDEVIQFLQEKIPQLKNAFRPKINDVNRLNFAIHDFKDFVPDADLKKEDLDLLSWAQVGNPRFIRPKGKKYKFSGSSTILPSHVLSPFGVFLFKIFKN